MEAALARARSLSDRLLAARTDHRRAEHRLAVMLAELADGRLHRVLGYASIEEYGVAVLDLTSRQARDLLRIGRTLPGLPALDAALDAGALDWTKARELIRIVTPETEVAWIDRAKAVSSRVLEREVADSLVGEPPPSGAPEPIRGPARRRLVFELESADAEVLLQALAVLRARSDLAAGEVDDGVLLAAMARRVVHDAEPEEAPTGERYRIVIQHCPTCRRTTSPEAEVSETIAAEAACDAEIIEMRPGPEQGHATRAIPPATRRIVLSRAGWRCEVPFCSNRLWLDVHHIAPRSEGGRHDPANLSVICCAHHRAVHDGVLALFRTPQGAIAVEHADGRRFVGPVPRGLAGGHRTPVGRDARPTGASGTA